MKKHISGVKPLILTLALLAAGPVHAVDLFYMKTLTLSVIHDVDQGKTESLQLDTAVKKYVADAGAVIYVKGQNLILIRNTRQPTQEIIDSGVSDFALHDGLIAYIKDSHLYVRRLEEDVKQASRRIEESQTVYSISIEGGMVAFLKSQGALYRVTDLASGKAERVVYPISEVQLSTTK